MECLGRLHEDIAMPGEVNRGASRQRFDLERGSNESLLFIRFQFNNQLIGTLKEIDGAMI